MAALGGAAAFPASASAAASAAARLGAGSSGTKSSVRTFSLGLRWRLPPPAPPGTPRPHAHPKLGTALRPAAATRGCAPAAPRAAPAVGGGAAAAPAVGDGSATSPRAAGGGAVPFAFRLLRLVVTRRVASPELTGGRSVHAPVQPAAAPVPLQLCAAAAGPPRRCARRQSGRDRTTKTSDEVERPDMTSTPPEIDITSTSHQPLSNSNRRRRRAQRCRPRVRAASGVGGRGPHKPGSG